MNHTIDGPKLSFGNTPGVLHAFAIRNISTQNQELPAESFKLLEVTNSLRSRIRLLMLVQPLLPFLSRRKLRTTNQNQFRSILLREKCSQLQTNATHTTCDQI